MLIDLYKAFTLNLNTNQIKDRLQQKNVSPIYDETLGVNTVGLLAWGPQRGLASAMYSCRTGALGCRV